MRLRLLLSQSQTTSFDAAGIFGVGVGYRFNNWFRADITGEYRSSANLNGIEVDQLSNGTCTITGQ